MSKVKNEVYFLRDRVKMLEDQVIILEFYRENPLGYKIDFDWMTGRSCVKYVKDYNIKKIFLPQVKAYGEYNITGKDIVFVDKLNGVIKKYEFDKDNELLIEKPIRKSTNKENKDV